MRTRAIVGLLLLASCCTQAAQPEVLPRVSVVRVTLVTGGAGSAVPYRCDRREGAVFWDTYLLTARHVVASGIKQLDFWVTGTDGNQKFDPFVATFDVVYQDKLMDVAVIKVVTMLPVPVNRVSGRAPVAHEPLLAIGCSLGEPPVITHGMAQYSDEEQGIWLTDAPVCPGNSGGPVVSSPAGEILGISIKLSGANNFIFPHMHWFLCCASFWPSLVAAKLT